MRVCVLKTSKDLTLNVDSWKKLQSIKKKAKLSPFFLLILTVQLLSRFFHCISVNFLFCLVFYVYAYFDKEVANEVHTAPGSQEHYALQSTVRLSNTSALYTRRQKLRDSWRKMGALILENIRFLYFCLCYNCFFKSYIFFKLLKSKCNFTS